MIIFKKYKVLILLIYISTNAIFGQNNATIDINDTIVFWQIKTDTLFNSKQIISLLTINKNTNEYDVNFDYSNSDLIKTSVLADSLGAIAAINGGFFDVDNGGSVTYFEKNDTVISTNKSTKNKWGKPNNLINGAVLITKDNGIVIDYAQQEIFYENSLKEKAVLITGPVLLINSKRVDLPKKKFVKKRHPRTCLCTTADSIIFIAIDGRQKDAQGMTLYEVQSYLKSLNCINAINLDGGGSTTMWIKHKGIVNFPSDKSGERPVANILSIYKIPYQK